jgi:hypothetical protein
VVTGGDIDLAIQVLDRTSHPPVPISERLCGIVIDEPGHAMLLELFDRTVDGRPTEVCDLISVSPRPVAIAYSSLDRLISQGLVIVTSDGGRRFRRVELSPPAFTAMKDRLLTHLQ